MISLNGGEAREVVRASEGEFIPGFQGFAWTADGNHLIFTKGKNPPSDDQMVELWKVAVDSGRAEKLDLVMERIRGLKAHPDGRHIGFSAGKIKLEVWMMKNFLPRTVGGGWRSASATARSLKR